MREIKYRAWVESFKCMDYRGGIAKEKKYGDSPVAIVNEILNRTDGFVFMQYAGLKDVNGVEIFEGDIVIGKSLDFQGMGVVQYFPPRFEIIGAKQHEGLFRVLESCCEVIGNIYENPELLEGK